MRSNVSTMYALRSLWRHARRTILSVLGIGLGCAVCLFVIGFVKGERWNLMRAAAESGAGHLRVAPAGWSGTRDNLLRLPDWEEVLGRLRGMDGVTIALPHARTEALLGFGTRVHGVEVLGVEAASEQTINRLVRNVVEGAYLQGAEEGTTVVGRGVSDRLDVELDDELMITVAGKGGQMRSAMLRIVGIVETGSEMLDATICHITLADVERITGYEGAGEVTVMIENPKGLWSMAERVREALGGGCEVLTWEEIVPELASGVKVDETWSKLTVGIIMIVVFLGIASAQLAAVLERRREFAMLSALGMKSRRLVGVMLTEGLVLGLLGAVLGMGLGIPATYWVATRGVDFSKFSGEVEMSMSNILFDTVFYGDFGWWLVPLAFGLALGATLLSSFYPAWYAVRTDPAAALRVEN